MDSDQQQSEEQIMRSVNEAISQKEQLERKLILAKIVQQKFTENLESTRIERTKELADTEMLKQHVEDVVKAEQYAAWHVNKVKLELKRRTALNNEMQKMVDTLHQNPLDREIEKAEKAFSSFYADIANAPWLPEKRKIQEEFKNYNDALSNVREEIAEYDETIARTKLEAELHAKLPFKAFCLVVANYKNKSNKIHQLMANEQAKAKRLKEKLSMMSDEEMRDSQSAEHDMTGVEAVTEPHQQHVEENRNDSIGKQCTKDNRNADIETQQLQPFEMDTHTQNDDVVAVEQQQQRMGEDDHQTDQNDSVQLQQQQLHMDKESQQSIFATPLPPVSAPRCCDDGDPQPLFDFFGGDGAADQSVMDGSFNFGSFMTNLAGPSEKGQQKQWGGVANAGDSQNDFNFNTFLDKADELSKEVTGGGLFDFKF